MKLGIKRLNILIVIVVAMLIVIGTYFYNFILPKINNIQTYKSAIEKAIEDKTGCPVQIDNLRSSLKLNLTYLLTADKFTLMRKDHSTLVSSDNVKIKIFVPAILFKKLLIKELDADNLFVDLKRLPDKKFELVELLKPKKGQKYNLHFNNSKININKYKINFDDLYFSPVQYFTFTGNKIFVKKFTRSKFIEVSAEGKMLYKAKTHDFNVSVDSSIPFKKNKFDIKGKISKVDLGDYFAYIHDLKPEILGIKGKSDLVFDIKKSKKFDLIANIEGFNLYIKKRGIVFDCSKSVFINVKGTLEKDSLQIEKFVGKAKDFKILVAGCITNLKDKDNRSLDVRIITDKGSRAESLIRLVPRDLQLKDHVVKKIIQYKVKGNIQTDLTLKGVVKKPLMYGKIIVDDVTILDDKLSKPSYGKIDFAGKKMILDTVLSVGMDKIVAVKGYVKPFYEKETNLSIKSTKNFDLNLGQQKLLALRDMIGFIVTPVEDMKFKGVGDVDMVVKGKLKDVDINGYVNFINATVSYKDLSKPGQNANGKIIFKDRKVYYDNIKANMENSAFTVNGYTDFKGFTDADVYFPNADLKVGFELINDSPLLELTKKTLVVIKKARGHTEAKINLVGPKFKVTSSGVLHLKDAYFEIDDISAPSTHVYGEVVYDKDSTTFNHPTGIMANSPVTMSGNINNGTSDLVITTKKMDVKAVFDMINNSPTMIGVKKSLREYSEPSGTMVATVNLAGNVKDKNLFRKGIFKIINVRLRHSEVSQPFTLTGGEFTVTPDKFYTKNLDAVVFDTKTKISGQVTGLKSGNIADMKQLMRFYLYDLDLKNMCDLIASKSVKPDVKQALSVYRYKTGKIDMDVRLLSTNQIVTVAFKNAKVDYIPTDAPILFKDGKMTVDINDMKFENLNAMISGSFVYVNGVIKNYNKTPVYDIFMNSYMDAEDFNTKIAPAFKIPIEASGKIPFNVVFKGNTENWKLRSQINLDTNSNIYYKGADLGEKEIRIINIDAEGNANQVKINNLKISTPYSELAENCDKQLVMEDAQKLVTLLEIKGKIKDFAEYSPMFENFYVNAYYPVNISLLNGFVSNSESKAPFFTTGEFQGRLNIEGKLRSPFINGSFYLQNVKIPSVQTEIKSADIDFTENSIILRDSSIVIADSAMQVGAIIDNVFDPPMMIRRVEINSNSINVDKVANAFKSLQNNSSKSSDNKDEVFGADLPPVVVMDGSIFSKELIISNLITDNFTAKFNLTPDWLLTVPEMSMDTAGGKVYGDLVYNLQSTELKGNVFAKDMEANAAATTFVKLPNEVYGKLNGESHFTTKGKTPKDLLSNANGYAKFNIADGRLIRLGSIEYLLRILNFVTGGITRMNLNSIVDIVAPHKTGYFNEISGKINVKNGKVFTDNVVSQGENLSLYISGSFEMLTSNIDATILGKMPKKISGALGPIGEVSIHSLIDLIPGVGYMPDDSQKPLIDIIPNLTKIPVLGLGGGKFRYFMVNLKGDLYGKDYVKGFKWVDPD